MNLPARYLSFLTFILTAGFADAGEVSLNYAREAWFGMRHDVCNALKLCTEFEKKPPENALLKAYYGASAAASPACLGNPAKKISYFRRGKGLIAEAVLLEPGNFEIRFLRFATQSKAPSFLDYNQDIAEDKRFLVYNLDKGRKTVRNKRIFDMMLEFLLTSDRLNAREKNLITQSSLTAE